MAKTFPSVTDSSWAFSDGLFKGVAFILENSTFLNNCLKSVTTHSISTCFGIDFTEF
jgi:hypothetical protein